MNDLGMIYGTQKAVDDEDKKEPKMASRHLERPFMSESLIILTSKPFTLRWPVMDERFYYFGYKLKQCSYSVQILDDEGGILIKE